jgi:hypothetical protein
MNTRTWLEQTARPLAVAVMIGCVALAVVDLAQRLVLGWNGSYAVAFCVLAAVEAAVSYRLLQNRIIQLGGTTKYRVAELVVLYTLVQVVGNLNAGRAPLEGLPGAGPETVSVFVMALLSWLAATQTIHDLNEIGEPPEQERGYVPPSDRLVARFFVGGGLLLLCSGLSRVDYRALLDPSYLAVTGPVLNVLVYFLLGLVMLAQMRYSALTAQWRRQEVQIDRRLPAAWLRYSVAFFALVALLAFLLPTSYTLGPLALLQYGLSVVLLGATLIGVLLTMLVLSPLAWLFEWLFGTSFGEGLSGPSQFQLPDPPPEAAGGGLLLRSVLFWLVLLALVVYTLTSYLRDRPEVLRALMRLGPLSLLRRLWAALWSSLRRAAASVGARLPRRQAQGRRRIAAAQDPELRPDPGGSPREQVLYYYLRALGRAAESGMPRRQGQTTYEYGATLGAGLPEARDEAEQLTEAFVEARYSRHPVQATRVGLARRSWERIRAALQALRK